MHAYVITDITYIHPSIHPSIHPYIDIDRRVSMRGLCMQKLCCVCVCVFTCGSSYVPVASCRQLVLEHSRMRVRGPLTISLYVPIQPYLAKCLYT